MTGKRRRRPSLLAGALVAVVMLVGCSFAGAESPGQVTKPADPTALAWNGEALDQAVRLLGQPTEVDGHSVWFCNGMLVQADVVDGVLEHAHQQFLEQSEWDVYPNGCAPTRR